MLYLIGMGLWDERDLSMRAIGTAHDCIKVYMEKYTSELCGSDMKKISRALGKPIVVLERKDVEGDASFIGEAKDGNIALLVGGDPLSATTHTDLVLRARKKGVEVRVVHNASIFSAVAETGLQLYKFGRTATVVFWEENYKPTSFYDAVKENTEKGMHTLLLLDIKPDRKMTPNQALETLIGLTRSLRNVELWLCRGWVRMTGGLLMARLAKLSAGTLVHRCTRLLWPGQLHEMEAKYLEAFK